MRKVEEINKDSCFIGRYFKQVVQMRRINRQVLARRLGFDYTDNDRMMCFFFKKKDYLWKQFEIEKWCGVLGISEDKPIYTKLMDRAGIKNYDYD